MAENTKVPKKQIFTKIKAIWNKFGQWNFVIWSNLHNEILKSWMLFKFNLEYPWNATQCQGPFFQPRCEFQGCFNKFLLIQDIFSKLRLKNFKSFNSISRICFSIYFPSSILSSKSKTNESNNFEGFFMLVEDGKFVLTTSVCLVNWVIQRIYKSHDLHWCFESIILTFMFFILFSF